MVYNKNFFQENDFFKNVSVEDLLDPLTKTITRRYITDYIQFLIANNIPFSVQIIDLDNFKLINDNYGHQIGDIVLVEFARRMKKAIQNNGFIGRFGGDEFLVVLPNIVKYNDIKTFISSNFFGENKPFRDKYKFSKELYITGTIGSASFPLDATNYDTLFKTIDKALYRGKEKGRNCYIIYVESKHKNINVSELKTPLSDIFFNIIKNVEDAKGDFKKEIENVNCYLKEKIKITSFIYLKNNELLGDNIDFLLNNKNYFFTNSIANIKKNYSKMYEFAEKNDFISFIILKTKHGYLMFTEGQIERMWQDEHIVILTFLSQILSFDNQ